MILIAFRSYLEQDRFFLALNAQKLEEPIDILAISTDQYLINRDAYFLSVTMRPMGATQFDFVRGLCQMSDCVSRVCIFNCTMEDVADDLHRLGRDVTSFGYISSVESVRDELGLDLSPEQASRLNGTIFNRNRSRSRGRRIVEQLIGQDIFVPLLPRIAANRPVSPPPKRPLERSFQDILHATSDVAEDGDPECVVCCDKRASICFVDCGCQVMCDECVRDMWEKCVNGKQCPTCRTDITRIVRPNQSGKKKKE